MAEKVNEKDKHASMVHPSVAHSVPVKDRHEKPVEKTVVVAKTTAPAAPKERCFGPGVHVTPPATIGELWVDHPWIVMQPEYKNHIFHEIPDCPYPKHTVLIDEENGIKFMKYIGDIGMDARGFIQGLFWLATAWTPPTDIEPPVELPVGPQTVNVPMDSAAILALATQPKVLVAGLADASLEFQSATGALTFVTVPYVDVGGVAVLQIRCGTTPVSADVPASAITGSVSTDIMFTALPGQVVQLGQPLTLALINGTLTDGDSTVALDVTYTVHPPVV